DHVAVGQNLAVRVDQKAGTQCMAQLLPELRPSAQESRKKIIVAKILSKIAGRDARLGGDRHNYGVFCFGNSSEQIRSHDLIAAIGPRCAYGVVAIGRLVGWL